MMPADNNTPHELPPIQPMSIDILEAWALEKVAHDALRDAHGLPPRGHRQSLTRGERARAKDLQPTAMLDHEGTLILKVDG
jgi:hypothetical protein